MRRNFGVDVACTLYEICASAVSKFCEAIVEYMANISSAPDPSVKIEYFSGEVSSAWEIFFSVWLTSKEAKVTFLVNTVYQHTHSVLTTIFPGEPGGVC